MSERCSYNKFRQSARAYYWQTRDHICGICGERIDSIEDMQLDHIMPLANGGQTEPSNVQLAHARCNTRKGSKIDLSTFQSVESIDSVKRDILLRVTGGCRKGTLMDWLSFRDIRYYDTLKAMVRSGEVVQETAADGRRYYVAPDNPVRDAITAEILKKIRSMQNEAGEVIAHEFDTWMAGMPGVYAVVFDEIVSGESVKYVPAKYRLRGDK